MMIRIFDKDINFIGVLEKFNSFQCSTPYANAGTFTVKCAMTDQALDLLQIGNIVVYKDFAGMIDSIQKTEELGEGAKVFASGYNLTGLLARRIIWNNNYYETTAENYLHWMVYDNATHASDAGRIIPHLDIEPVQNYPEMYDVQNDHQNLLQALVDCAENVGYGFNVELDIPNKKMWFRVLVPNDRTTGSDLYVLGKRYDNVIEQEYTYSIKNSTNTVLVVSDDGEATYSPGLTGLDRQEAYLKSNQKKESLTDAQFAKMLKTEGKNSLLAVIDSFDIDTTEPDLAVGDVVSIVDREWGITHSAMVSEKQITLQDGKETINYLFGNDIGEK